MNCQHFENIIQLKLYIEAFVESKDHRVQCEGTLHRIEATQITI